MGEWGFQIPKTAPSAWGTWTPSTTPMPWLTPLTIPNGMQIQSAVLPQYTFRTDRPTDRQMDTHTQTHTDGLGDRSETWALTLTRLIDSDALIIIEKKLLGYKIYLSFY